MYFVRHNRVSSILLQRVPLSLRQFFKRSIPLSLWLLMEWCRLFRLWCNRYICGVILDHSIILIWIFDPEPRIITRISALDLPSRLVHQLVTSPVTDLYISRSTTAIRPTANTMCIILGSIMVIGSLLSMVTPYRQETLLLVADQTSIHSCPNGLFLGRWGVVSTRALWHLEICRVT